MKIRKIGKIRFLWLKFSSSSDTILMKLWSEVLSKHNVHKDYIETYSIQTDIIVGYDKLYPLC